MPMTERYRGTSTHDHADGAELLQMAVDVALDLRNSARWHKPQARVRDCSTAVNGGVHGSRPKKRSWILNPI
jgi:hypothetical protein